MVIETR